MRKMTSVWFLCVLIGLAEAVTPPTEGNSEEDLFKSYLYWPRLHFSGLFQADTPTVNNVVPNYNISSFTEMTAKLDTDGGNGGWNPNGTSAFRLAETMVTRICFTDGHCSTDKELDPIIGSYFQEDGYGSVPKMVVLDPEHILTSTVYGLQLRIGNFFSGTVRACRKSYFWVKEHGNASKHAFLSGAATFHTIVENVTWLEGATNSPFLRQLREAVSSSKTGKLSLRFHLDQYQTCTFSEHFNWGRVVGAIGVSGSRAPLSTVHGRELEPRHWKIAQTAPFVLDHHNRRVHVDFGNSLPTTLDGSHLVNFVGQLAVGYSRDQISHSLSCSNSFEWVGLVHYRRPNWYQTTAGIQTFPESYPMGKEQMKTLTRTPLVVAEVEGSWPDISCKEIFLEEADHGTLVRPHQEWIFRLDAEEPLSFDLFVTKFGKPFPEAPVVLRLKDDNLENSPLTLPSEPSVTNENGIVSFTVPTSDPKNPRKVIDGQVFTILFTIADQSFGNKFVIYVLIWDKYQINSAPNWVDHVYPIFKQYANLYPAMTNEFVDLGSFEGVTKNRKLIQMCLSLPFEHPNYMPPTRDLSNAKRKMLLQWLSQPELLYGAQGNKSKQILQAKHAPRTGFRKPIVKCKSNAIMSMKHSRVSFQGNTENVTPKMLLRQGKIASNNAAVDFTSDNYKHSAENELKRGFDASKDQVHNSNGIKGHLEKADNIINPFPPVQRFQKQQSSQTNGYNREKLVSSDGNVKRRQESRFTLKQLRQDLQTALEVEHATIPPYLTALSSIKNGQNNKVSHILKSILVQEMLHLSLVANLLNAVGGKPSLTHPDFVPRYPSLLPGGLLQGLMVPLQNLSRNLVKDVFMKIEEPELTIKALEDQQYVMKQKIDYWHQRGVGFYGENTIKTGEHSFDILSGNNTMENEKRQGREEKRDVAQEGRQRELYTTKSKGNEETVERWPSDGPENVESNDVFEQHRDTIGTFYSHIKKTLRNLTNFGKDNSIFTGHPSRQVKAEMWYARKSFGHGKIIEVTDYLSAVRAITEIIEEGEGSSPCTPVAADVDIHDLSHYFSFFSIYEGRRVQVQKWNEKELPAGISEEVRRWFEICHSIYTFDGAAIDFDPTGIWPIIHNPQLSDYTPWSHPYLQVMSFNTAYTKLLASLEQAYNGHPEVIKDAMGLMFSVSLNAKRLMRMPLKFGDNPNVGPNAAPIYEPIT